MRPPTPAAERRASRAPAGVRLTFLGTGTSFGVPQIGCGCAVCRSPDPHDRRSRVGALVETDGGRRLLIDTPPELRLQLVDAGVAGVDAVLYTHEHADHTHGIDDVRAFAADSAAPLTMYAAAATADALRHKFGYIFDAHAPLAAGTFKPNGRLQVLHEGVTVRIWDADVTPVRVPHGDSTVVFAYRIGPLAYVTDAKAVPEAALAVLRGARVLVLNALFRHPHSKHLSIPEAVAVAEQVGAARTYLTHLTHRIAHADLEAELPPHVRPAYDGLTVEV
jgi:phosphoribosyl 1,2-cyclic phosphate phosphodiesterase